MSSVQASTAIAASLAETWDHYFEPRGWAAWVDQFSAVVDAGGDYPESGGTLRWRSGSAGRGEVRERVLDHEPRRLHRIGWEDPQSSGRLTTTFEIKGDRTEVTQELDYELIKGGAFAAITDRLFVRSQMRRSLERSLAALKHEVEELAARG
jgi:Polyketide cyclase / dehydrase and lipid transport